jgi:hypothetical protein
VNYKIRVYSGTDSHEGNMTRFHTLTADQVATAYRLHPRTVLHLAEEGAIPAQEVMGEWRFNRLELADWFCAPEDWNDDGPEDQLAQPRLRLV